jgi:hypothetical protein
MDDGMEGQVQSRLKTSSYPAVRRVRCMREREGLALRGYLPNYYCVQVAINLARAAIKSGVPIHNYLQVCKLETHDG